MKSVYTTYKERLVEISGKSRSIYSKKGDSKFSCDLSKFLMDVYVLDDFVNFIWTGSGKPFEIVGKDTSESLYYSSGTEMILKEKYPGIIKGNKKEANALRATELKKIVSNSVNTFYKLKKEIGDIARETGRYELYVGYPFVEGKINGDMSIKAPLILFPVRINISDDSHVNLELVKDMPVTLNKALLMAYAKEKRINIDDMIMEFGNNFSKSFKDIDSVIKYLKNYHIDIDYKKGILSDILGLDGLTNDERDNGLSIVNHCVVGRYPLANSIYMDYSELENRRGDTNEAIEELIYAKSPKRTHSKSSRIYNINKLDYTQEQAVRRINNDGNMVIYGPPGTGKSQTIVNVISDALARKKKVLIVSQKKAALDVVYNRLGSLKSRAMFIADTEKEKETFYKRCGEAHKEIERFDCSEVAAEHERIEKSVQADYEELKKIFSVLYEPTEFGANLEEMYEQSSQISKNSFDYDIYEALTKRKYLLLVKYESLKESLNRIRQNNRKDLYYKYETMKSKNPILDHFNNNLDVYAIDTAFDKVNSLLNSKNKGFDISKYPYCSYLIAHYIYNIDKENLNLDELVAFIAKQNNKKGLIKPSDFERDLKANFKIALAEIRQEVSNYEFLRGALDEKGYQMAIGAILNGNISMLKNLKSGLQDYKRITDIKLELANLTDLDREILDFAYNLGDSTSKYNQVLDNFMPIRMYIEIVKAEKDRKEDLAKIMNFSSIKEDILTLKRKQEELAKVLAFNRANNSYIDNYETNKKSKDFLYQISKQQHSWSIRKFMKEYSDLMLDLYPCWLLSPENASTVLPLVKNMFDIVLIDEASQVFIENTLPLVYRAKNVVIAGDSKQLRPTSTFMKRYMGSDIEDSVDPTTEATLEVESLLDLATSRLPSTNLNYHYRSRNQELIDFSNSYFYDGKLEIVPNLVGGRKNNAIKRVKVNGSWTNRRNEEEAKATVALIKKILSSRKNNESIGVISFNSDQASAIEEEIRNECKRDTKFAQAILKEQNRYDGNEDVSLFVKNLENVQGDERDIIILSTGYAPNENGKVHANFGSLSLEGGENRLNVAITRAKSRTFVVTSIEPEDLKVETTKNEGPKLLKKYLTYVRAVSNNKKEETRICLSNQKGEMNSELDENNHVAEEIKEALEKLGYTIDVKIGNTKKKIDLAVYDKELDKYILGIECINKNYKNLEEMIENRIYHDGFLESRGWNIYHVWTRDWWMSKAKVINSIVKEIEKATKDKEGTDRALQPSVVIKRK